MGSALVFVTNKVWFCMTKALINCLIIITRNQGRRCTLEMGKKLHLKLVEILKLVNYEIAQ